MPRNLLRDESVLKSSLSISAAKYWPVAKCLNLNNVLQLPVPDLRGSLNLKTSTSQSALGLVAAVDIERAVVLHKESMSFSYLKKLNY